MSSSQYYHYRFVILTLIVMVVVVPVSPLYYEPGAWVEVSLRAARARRPVGLLDLDSPVEFDGRARGDPRRRKKPFEGEGGRDELGPAGVGRGRKGADELRAGVLARVQSSLTGGPAAAASPEETGGGAIFEREGGRVESARALQ